MVEIAIETEGGARLVSRGPERRAGDGQRARRTLEMTSETSRKPATTRAASLLAALSIFTFATGGNCSRARVESVTQMNEGVVLAQTGRHIDAVESLERATAIDPTNVTKDTVTVFVSEPLFPGSINLSKNRGYCL